MGEALVLCQDRRGRALHTEGSIIKGVTLVGLKGEKKENLGILKKNCRRRGHQGTYWVLGGGFSLLSVVQFVKGLHEQKEGRDLEFFFVRKFSW